MCTLVSCGTTYSRFKVELTYQDGTKEVKTSKWDDWARMSYLDDGCLYLCGHGTICGVRSYKLLQHETREE